LLIWDAPLLIPLNKGLEMEYLGARGKREMQGAWGNRGRESARGNRGERAGDRRHACERIWRGGDGATDPKGCRWKLLESPQRELAGFYKSPF
jgi:hypothetical protein